MILATGNGITKSFLSLEELPLKYSINISIVFKGFFMFCTAKSQGKLIKQDSLLKMRKWEYYVRWSSKSLLSRTLLQKICIIRMILVLDNPKLLSKCFGFKVARYIQNIMHLNWLT